MSDPRCMWLHVQSVARDKSRTFVSTSVLGLAEKYLGCVAKVLSEEEITVASSYSMKQPVQQGVKYQLRVALHLEQAEGNFAASFFLRAPLASPRQIATHCSSLHLHISTYMQLNRGGAFVSPSSLFPALCHLSLRGSIEVQVSGEGGTAMLGLSLSDLANQLEHLDMGLLAVDLANALLFSVLFGNSSMEKGLRALKCLNVPSSSTDATWNLIAGAASTTLLSLVCQGDFSGHAAQAAVGGMPLLQGLHILTPHADVPLPQVLSLCTASIEEVILKAARYVGPLDYLAHCGALRALSLEATNGEAAMNEELARGLACHQTIERLNVSYCDWIADISFCRSCPRLSTLLARSTKVANTASLSGHPSLTEVDFSQIFGPHQSFDFVNQCPSLRRLELDFTAFETSSAFITAVSFHPSLQYISIFCATEVGSLIDILRTVASCPNIQIVKADGCNLSEDGSEEEQQLLRKLRRRVQLVW